MKTLTREPSIISLCASAVTSKTNLANPATSSPFAASATDSCQVPLLSVQKSRQSLRGHFLCDGRQAPEWRRDLHFAFAFPLTIETPARRLSAGVCANHCADNPVAGLLPGCLVVPPKRSRYSRDSIFAEARVHPGPRRRERFPGKDSYSKCSSGASTGRETKHSGPSTSIPSAAGGFYSIHPRRKVTEFCQP
jgi:hypothetical protein